MILADAAVSWPEAVVYIVLILCIFGIFALLVWKGLD